MNMSGGGGPEERWPVPAEDPLGDAGPTGMGPRPTGPGFAPWHPEADQPDRNQPVPASPAAPPPAAEAFRPRSTRMPSVVTAAAFVLVALAVAISSLLAFRSDTQIAVTQPENLPRPPGPSAQDDLIDFSTPAGSGQLVVLNHRWVPTGREPPESGSYLQVEVELRCKSGQVDYDPYNFQVFDEAGQLFDVAESGAPGAVLPVGTLRAGERIRGFLAFDLPRGAVTLLMSDDSSESVTALRIPD